MTPEERRRMDRVYLQAFGAYLSFCATLIVVKGAIELVRHHC